MHTVRPSAEQGAQLWEDASGRSRLHRGASGKWKPLSGALGCGLVKASGRGDPGEAGTTWREGGAAAAAYRPRACGRPRASKPTARPGPTVELEMADALAPGVPGRGAAEAAPQGLGLAALRPPAAARKG